METWGFSTNIKNLHIVDKRNFYPIICRNKHIDFLGELAVSSALDAN